MWWYLAVFVVTYAVVVARTPKPQSRPPAGIEEFQVPTAKEGREVPILFGTRLIKGPNVVWYGDLRTEAIRKKGGKK